MKIFKNVSVECEKCYDIVALPSHLIRSSELTISAYLFSNHWELEDNKIKCPSCNYCDYANSQKGQYKVVYNSSSSQLVVGRIDRLKTLCEIQGALSFDSKEDAETWISKIK